ncbi:MAG: hypothetical protein KBB83_00950 [Alphaproteobacteria bacterium]|nr:hypothetical protein [Alphaproteobacteria bacterium]
MTNPHELIDHDADTCENIITIDTNICRLPPETPFQVFDIKDKSGKTIKQVRALSLADVLASDHP